MTPAAVADSIQARSDAPVHIEGSWSMVGRGGVASAQTSTYSGTMLLRHAVGTLWISTQSAVRTPTGARLSAQNADNESFSLNGTDIIVTLDQQALSWAVRASDDASIRIHGLADARGRPAFVQASFTRPTDGPAASASNGIRPRPAYVMAWGLDRSWAQAGHVTESPEGFPNELDAMLDAAGDITAFIGAGLVSFHGADGGAHSFVLGVDRSGELPGTGTGQATVRHLGFAGSVQSASLPLAGESIAGAPSMTWDLSTATLVLENATGQATYRSKSVAFERATVRLTGASALLATQDAVVPTPSQYAADGSFTDLTIDGASLSPARAPVPAEVTLTALAILLLCFTKFGQGLAIRVMVGLYSRLSSRDILEHPQRRLILDITRTEPGIHLRELQRRVGLAWGAFTFHIRTLEKASHIRIEKSGEYRLVSPLTVGGLGPETTIAAGLARRLFQALPLDGSPVETLELGASLGMTRQLVNYHVRALQARGLVTDQGHGGKRMIARANVTPSGAPPPPKGAP